MYRKPAIRRVNTSFLALRDGRLQQAQRTRLQVALCSCASSFDLREVAARDWRRASTRRASPCGWARIARSAWAMDWPVATESVAGRTAGIEKGVVLFQLCREDKI